MIIIKRSKQILANQSHICFLSSEIISTSPYPETIHPIHQLIAPQREMAFFAHILLHDLAKSSYYKELTDEIHC